MPNYIPDPNDSSKQIPGPKTDQHYDRFTTPTAFSGSFRQPSYVLLTAAAAGDIGFFFGSAKQFSSSAASEGNNPSPVLSGSQYYQGFGQLAAGQYMLNPIAVSGSDVDVAKVRFVYKGGLDGMGRP